MSERQTVEELAQEVKADFDLKLRETKFRLDEVDKRWPVAAGPIRNPLHQ
jgi:hypothetical protein